MKNMKLYKTIGYIIGFLLAAAFILGAIALSWIATCGIVWLVTWCFGWTFSWPIATGVWVIWWCVCGIFRCASGK